LRQQSAVLVSLVGMKTNQTEGPRAKLSRGQLRKNAFHNFLGEQIIGKGRQGRGTCKEKPSKRVLPRLRMPTRRGIKNSAGSEPPLTGSACSIDPVNGFPAFQQEIRRSTGRYRQGTSKMDSTRGKASLTPHKALTWVRQCRNLARLS